MAGTAIYARWTALTLAGVPHRRWSPGMKTNPARRAANQIPWQERSGPAGWGVRRRAQVSVNAPPGRTAPGRSRRSDKSDGQEGFALPGGFVRRLRPARSLAGKERSRHGRSRSVSRQASADDGMPGWLLGAQAEQESSDGRWGACRSFPGRSDRCGAGALRGLTQKGERPTQ